jgi:preprotein translocase subunit SecB
MQHNMENIAFQFKSFLVKRSLIELNDGEPDESFNVSINPSGEIFPSRSVFQLKLEIKVYDNKEVINIDLVVLASFVFNTNIKKTELDNYFFVNAPAIVFPYVRAYLSTLTNLSGLRPLNLPTLNLTTLKDKLKQNTRDRT